jgi:hypothetical protein
MSDDTYEMHDLTNTPLELPPSQVVAWDPVSFVSEKNVKKTKRLMKMPKLLKKHLRQTLVFTAKQMWPRQKKLEMILSHWKNIPTKLEKLNFKFRMLLKMLKTISWWKII